MDAMMERVLQSWAANTTTVLPPPNPPDSAELNESMKTTSAVDSFLEDTTNTTFSAPGNNTWTGLFFQPEVDIAIPLVYSVVCILGLIGNSLVITVVLRFEKMKTVANIYILNLAIADELFMLSLPFFVVSILLVDWPFGDVMCRVVLSVDAMNMFTSCCCITAMSVDRYLAIVYPMKSLRWRTPCRAKLTCLCIWLASCAIICPVPYFAGVETFVDTTGCMLKWPDDSWDRAWIVYCIILGFLLPVVVITFCSVKIAQALGRQSNQLFFEGDVKLSASRRQQETRRKHKVTKMILAVIVTFVVCWLPFYVGQIVNLVAELPPTKVLMGVYNFILCLSYVNSCVNPFIYFLVSESFRKNVKYICSSRAAELSRTNTEMLTNSFRATARRRGTLPAQLGHQRIDSLKSTKRHSMPEVKRAARMADRHKPSV
ncbi:somatostatin receptor type 2-like [Branchiostoma lanceolatum]|uniref:somatostatin receptor type 2-like n=1 Tax=Branchiostoma lanceolatum TaxID=7740 RepID=UPI003456DEB4